MDIAQSVAVKVQNAGNLRFERSCDGKVHYPDEHAAKGSAKLMHKRHHKQFDTYKCRYCDGWHVGSTQRQ